MCDTNSSQRGLTYNTLNTLKIKTQLRNYLLHDAFPTPPLMPQHPLKRNNSFLVPLFILLLLQHLE